MTKFLKNIFNLKYKDWSKFQKNLHLFVWISSATKIFKPPKYHKYELLCSHGCSSALGFGLWNIHSYNNDLILHNGILQQTWIFLYAILFALLLLMINDDTPTCCPGLHAAADVMQPIQNGCHFADNIFKYILIQMTLCLFLRVRLALRQHWFR